MGMMNLDGLRAQIEQTGMCPNEAADYLDDMLGSDDLPNSDQAHKDALQILISQIEMRVLKALELNKSLSGSQFLREIGSWNWPYPSVERKFYEYLFRRMAQT